MKQEENSITEKSSLDESYFFDSYAFFEIINQNENYKKYIGCKIITTKLNLFELYHNLLKDKNEDIAKVSLDKYYQFCVDFDKEVIVEAAELKKEINKRDVSMTDCIGYAMAKQLGIKFLTGDDAFKDMENVEFVK